MGLTIEELLLVLIGVNCVICFGLGFLRRS